jgi:hypothetical protein
MLMTYYVTRNRRTIIVMWWTHKTGHFLSHP